MVDSSSIEAMEETFKTIEASMAFIQEPVTQTSRIEWFCCACYLQTVTDFNTKEEERELLIEIISNISYISFIEKLKKVCIELYQQQQQQQQQQPKSGRTLRQEECFVLMDDIKEMGGGYCVSVAMHKKYVQTWNRFMSFKPDKNYNTNRRKIEDGEESSTILREHKMKEEIGWLLYLLGKQSEKVTGSDITHSYYLMLASIVFLVHQSKFLDVSSSSMSLIKMEDPEVSPLTNYSPLVQEVCQFNGLTTQDQVTSVENYIQSIERNCSIFMDFADSNEEMEEESWGSIPLHETVDFLVDHFGEFETYVLNEQRKTMQPFQFNENVLIKRNNSLTDSTITTSGDGGDMLLCNDKKLSRELGLVSNVKTPLNHQFLTPKGDRSQYPSNAFFTAAMESSMLLHSVNHMKRNFSCISSLLLVEDSVVEVTTVNASEVLKPLHLHICDLLNKLKTPLLKLGNEDFVQTVLTQCECLYVHSLEELFEETPMSEQFINNLAFHSVVFAVSTEIVLKAHSLVIISFPQLLQLLDISAYTFSHVLVYYIEKVTILPGSMQQHLERIHETILKKQVWRESITFEDFSPNEENKTKEDILRNADGESMMDISVFLNPKKLQTLFFESVYKFISELVSMLIDSFGNTLMLLQSRRDRDQPYLKKTNDLILKQCVNELMQKGVDEHIHMLRNRDLVHVVLCSFYATCKILNISISFNEMIEKYIVLFRCPLAFFENISLGDGKYGDIITFFNRVYLIEMKSELKKMSENSITLKESDPTSSPCSVPTPFVPGTITKMLQADLEQRSFISSRLGLSKFRVSVLHSPSKNCKAKSRALRVPYMRRSFLFNSSSTSLSKDEDRDHSNGQTNESILSSNVSYESNSSMFPPPLLLDASYHSPSKTKSASTLTGSLNHANIVYSFGKSPSKDLFSINNALKKRKSLN